MASIGPLHFKILKKHFKTIPLENDLVHLYPSRTIKKGHLLITTQNNETKAQIKTVTGQWSLSVPRVRSVIAL